MLRDYSKFGKLLYVGFILTVMGTLAYLSYVWSLGQTQTLFATIMPTAATAFVAALMIQLLPQAMFAASHDLVRKEMWITALLATCVGLAANLIDAATNVGALQLAWQDRNVSTLAYYVGMSMAVLITFGEELLLLLFLSLIALLREYYGIDTSDTSLLGHMARTARGWAVPAYDRRIYGRQPSGQQLSRKERQQQAQQQKSRRPQPPYPTSVTDRERELQEIFERDQRRQ